MPRTESGAKFVLRRVALERNTNTDERKKERQNLLRLVLHEYQRRISPHACSELLEIWPNCNKSPFERSTERIGREVPREAHRENQASRDSSASATTRPQAVSSEPSVWRTCFCPGGQRENQQAEARLGTSTYGSKVREPRELSSALPQEASTLEAARNNVTRGGITEEWLQLRGLPWLQPKNRDTPEHLADEAAPSVGMAETRSCARTVTTQLLRAQIKRCEAPSNAWLQGVFGRTQGCQVECTTQ